MSVALPHPTIMDALVRHHMSCHPSHTLSSLSSHICACPFFSYLCSMSFLKKSPPAFVRLQGRVTGVGSQVIEESKNACMCAIICACHTVGVRGSCATCVLFIWHLCLQRCHRSRTRTRTLVGQTRCHRGRCASFLVGF